MARTFATVVTEVLTRLRLDTTAQPMVEGWVNDVIQDVHGRFDWFWALDRAVVQTVLDKTAGTVALVSGGTTVTGTSTAFASTDVGSFIQFSGNDDWYKILTVPSSVSLTIEKPYTGTTDLTVGTYTIRKVFYTLSGAERILSASQAIIARNLTCLHFKDFDRYVPFSDTTGKASSYCLYGVDSSGDLQFTVNPVPDEVYNLEIRYKKKATEDSIVATPEKWRSVYEYGSLVKGYEYVAFGQPDFDKTMVREKKNDYEGMIARMKKDASPSTDYHPQLQNRDVQITLPFPKLPDGLSIPLD